MKKIIHLRYMEKDLEISLSGWLHKFILSKNKWSVHDKVYCLKIYFFFSIDLYLFQKKKKKKDAFEK